MNDVETLQEAKENFIASWGALGTSWGISRTMAQIHALLMITPEAMSTDEVMKELEVSRGNAHSNLKELVSWGLIRTVVKKGERKEFFEAEKDVWKAFIIIIRERKRREIDPAITLIDECYESTKSLQEEEAKAFNKQLEELSKFAHFGSSIADKVMNMNYGPAMKIASKVLH